MPLPTNSNKNDKCNFILIETIYYGLQDCNEIRTENSLMISVYETDLSILPDKIAWQLLVALKLLMIVEAP